MTIKTYTRPLLFSAMAAFLFAVPQARAEVNTDGVTEPDVVSLSDADIQIAADDMAVSSGFRDALRKAAIDDGRFILNVRFRYEFVDEVTKTRDANATNVRTRFGYETGLFHGFGLGADADWTQNIGRELYNSTTNGRTLYPVVADPKVSQLNQAFIKMEGVIPDTKVKVGRQRIIWDNHRFIGNVGWRQNEQTFDSARVVNASLPDTALEYIYINKVHTIFGADSNNGFEQMNSHLAHAAYSGFDIGTITGYALMLDYDRPRSYGKSHWTTGLRFKGDHAVNDMWKVLYTGEYAHQESWKDNTSDYGVNYWFGEGGVTYSGAPVVGPITAKVGYEVLTGTGRNSFQTPLATLHLFQGWDDKFLTTPNDGITDLYVSAGTSLYGAKIYAAYHWFDAEHGNTDYGREFDFDIKRKFYDHYTAQVTYGQYIAENYSSGTKKLWLSLIYNY